MANDISDVIVNIDVEDVINPASFGGILLYNRTSDSDNTLDYTEVYSYAEAKQAINGSNMNETHFSMNVDNITIGDNVTKATLNAIDSHFQFTADTYKVEKNTKTIGGKNFTNRVKAIADDNGIQIKTNTSGTKTTGLKLKVYCALSSANKMVTLTIKNSAGNVVDSKDVTKTDGEVISLDMNDSDTYTLYSTSADGATVHIYEIDIVAMNINARKMLSMAEIVFSQEKEPDKLALLACELDDLENYLTKDWRYLCLVETGSNINSISEIASYIESCGAMKVFVLDTSTDGSSGTGNSVTVNSYISAYNAFKTNERTFVTVGVPRYIGNEVAANSIGTALIANTQSKMPGSFTYKNMSLKSVATDENINKATLTKYHNYNINAYVHKAGYDVTSDGKCANGGYLDILDSKDWLITQIKYRIQQALIINDKIPYTDTGINILSSVVTDVLNDAYNNGMINTNDSGLPDYTVNFAKRSETKASDRELRQYVEGKFSFGLAGAIHSVTVNGTILI